jgi:hypothetical protein
MNPQSSLRIGNQLRSTLLLQDINLLEVITHITHERTIERYTSLIHIMSAHIDNLFLGLFTLKEPEHTENSKLRMI